MPILDIEIVGPSQEGPGLAKKLAEACATALNSRPSGTWVRLRHLSANHYAENGPPQNPVFVTVLLSDLPETEHLKELACALGQVVAQTLGRPSQQVHLLFEPPARGRIAFGGDLLA